MEARFWVDCDWTRSDTRVSDDFNKPIEANGAYDLQPQRTMGIWFDQRSTGLGMEKIGDHEAVQPLWTLIIPHPNCLHSCMKRYRMMSWSIDMVVIDWSRQSGKAPQCNQFESLVRTPTSRLATRLRNGCGVNLERLICEAKQIESHKRWFRQAKSQINSE
jgi:hypothetical protein